MTVEQDVLFPFIPNDKVEEMKKEPIFQKYKIDASNLTRGLVSCTGAQVRMHHDLWLSIIRPWNKLANLCLGERAGSMMLVVTEPVASTEGVVPVTQ